MADITRTHTETETSWIHLDSLESGEKSDDSRDFDDIQSWVTVRSDDEDEREFEEPQIYETKTYSASDKRLDCGRNNNSKWSLVITKNLPACLSVKFSRFFNIFDWKHSKLLVFRNIDTKKGWKNQKTNELKWVKCLQRVSFSRNYPCVFWRSIWMIVFRPSRKMGYAYRRWERLKDSWKIEDGFPTIIYRPFIIVYKL